MVGQSSEVTCSLPQTRQLLGFGSPIVGSIAIVSGFSVRTSGAVLAVTPAALDPMLINDCGTDGDE
jgi:hypothetical protein